MTNLCCICLTNWACSLAGTWTLASECNQANKKLIKMWRKENPTNFFPTLFSQKLRNFHSLSCLGVTSEDGCEADQGLLTSRGRHSPVRLHAAEDVQSRTKESVASDPAMEEARWSSAPDFSEGTLQPTNRKEGEPLWAGLCGGRTDVYQLGGELDIEQIERN